MMKLITIIFVLIINLSANAQLANVSSVDSVLGQKLIRDAKGATLAWYKPNEPGAAYSHVMKLASEFLINTCPVDEKTGLPLYLVTCCFHKPDLKGKTYVGEGWPHNPACFFAGSVQSFALDYYSFSGDYRLVQFVGDLLAHQLEFGTTPTSWVWGSVPYASSEPFEKEYNGATRWEAERSRGDGLHVIEPDKVGELGYGYLKFYQITEDQKYLDAALSCANALAKHVRQMPDDNSPFIESGSNLSPWPFRVNARTGVMVSEYCSNVVEPVRLFDELLRIKQRLQLDTTSVNSYQRARDIAWNWLFSRSGPMKTYVWNAYFEDIPNDESQANRNQLTPGETARYLIKNEDITEETKKDVPALIAWIASVFKTDGYDAIKEQTWCYEPMGSHTARYGSLCALWYEKTGDQWYKDEAYRFLNFATYMTLPDGFVAVGPNWPGAWFSDGYSDYVRHFADAMAAVPEWAPKGENHLLRSTSAVQNIVYKPNEITFSTFDNESKVVMKTKSKPKAIHVNGKLLLPEKVLGENCWTWTPLNNGGVVRLNYSSGNKILVGL